MKKFSLYEKRVETLQLTSNQKAVLAKIVAAPTPKVAAQEISGDRGIVAARDLLIKLGLITFGEGSMAALTASGKKMAVDDDIIDDTGALTPEGKELAAEKNEQPATESYKLIKQITEAKHRFTVSAMDTGYTVFDNKEGTAVKKFPYSKDEEFSKSARKEAHSFAKQKNSEK